MKELAYWLLLLVCMSVYAACSVAWIGLLLRGAARWRRAAYLVGCLGAVIAGGALPWALGVSAAKPVTSGCLVIAYGNMHLWFGFVWLKRRLRRRKRALSPFWDAVADDYFWRKGGQDEGAEPVATELEAAEAPVGRGTEPEASAAPAGRGDELVGLIQAGDADAQAEDARSASRAGPSERAGPPSA